MLAGIHSGNAGALFFIREPGKMKCEKFRCVYEIDGECEADGGGCIGDMCESFGDCTTCQDQNREECGVLE